MGLDELRVGEARNRRARRSRGRERHVLVASGCLYLLAASACLAFLPNHRAFNVPLIVGLLVGMALVSRVRFEFGGYYTIAEQLIHVPALLLAPLPVVPLLGIGPMLALLPEVRKGEWHRDRMVDCFADSWPQLFAVLVIAWLAPGPVDLDETPAYCAAFGAQFGGNLGWGIIRNELIDRVPLRELLNSYKGTAQVDAALTPLGFVSAIAAASQPWLLIAVIPPLVWLLRFFSQDRRERYAATIELNRAYRGTVMLLSDVIETDDPYTADHSRSVVELAGAVGQQLGLDLMERQRLEFAAMLHDVGKIAIPDEILNKPAALTADEFDRVKTHVIEGQYLLDRVGGLLGEVGEIVRSCHERWDGRGYPDGLHGTDIPLAARIVFACDAFSAITTDRPYRSARSRDRALAELSRGSGNQFDPRVVAALIQVIEEQTEEPLPIDDLRALLATRAVPRGIGATT
jgi:HD-GYP domain-containing protein (c-di-GMP phosphodiesterase class II)